MALAVLLAPPVAAQDAGPPVDGTAPSGAERAPPGQAPEPSVQLQPPQLLHFVEARYPASAQAEGLAAQVILTLEIDALGAVTRADVAQPAGHGFDEAAVAAALGFRFAPATRGGTPIASRISYSYEFHPPAPASPLPPVAPPAVAAMPPPGAPGSPTLDVTVQGPSRVEQLRESAQAIKVIDTSRARRRTADVGEVLARTEGLRVQRSGGLGSQTRLSLHGLTDDQVRVFLDGVPLELSGFGLGVSTVPVGWLERIEVYRGVVPVELGTDALGGAVQLVSEGAARNGASASYAAGAFDTHQLALNATRVLDEGQLLLRASAFYDTSRNDYLVRARVADAQGRLRYANVRRFHDGYRALGTTLEAGLLHRPWAESLVLRLFASDFAKDLQHNANMSVPYGEVTYGQSAAGGTLRYRAPLWTHGWRLTALLGYGYRSIDYRDASRWVYDWFGNRVFERAEGSGEVTLFARDLTQWEHRALGRVVSSHLLAPGHTLRLVVAPDFTTRDGSERLRTNPDRIDPLTTVRNILQVTSGVEYLLHDASDRLENSAFAKHYLYRPATDQVRTFDNSIEHIEDSTSRFGAGDAFRIRLLDGWIGKLSYEYATRLPRADEVFGDGVLILPNLELVPESSHNANLGLLGSIEPQALGQLSFELSGFLRHTEQMVVRLLADDRVHSIHQNVFDVRTQGVDATLSWQSPQRWLSLSGNGTYQDQRNSSEQGPFTPFEGQRLPNRPWLYANGELTFRVPRLTGPRSELSLSWLTRYVHEFLPGWADTSAPDDENRIPDQLTHGVSIVHTSASGPLRVDAALDLTNLTDARTYDVLGVQKPGRAAFFKLTVCWECAPDPTSEGESPDEPSKL